MPSDIISNFPPKSRVYAAVSLCALLLLGFIGPYMSHRESLALDHEILALEGAIKEQKMFHEAYAPMKRLLDEPQSVDLPPIKIEALNVEETTRIGVTLGRLAEDAGLRPLAIHPDVSSLLGHRGEIIVDARVAGTFRGLRSFIRDLGALPSLKEFVSMEIREIPQAREMHLKARFHTQE